MVTIDLTRMYTRLCAPASVVQETQMPRPPALDDVVQYCRREGLIVMDANVGSANLRPAVILGTVHGSPDGNKEISSIISVTGTQEKGHHYLFDGEWGQLDIAMTEALDKLVRDYSPKNPAAQTSLIARGYGAREAAKTIKVAQRENKMLLCLRDEKESKLYSMSRDKCEANLMWFWRTYGSSVYFVDSPVLREKQRAAHMHNANVMAQAKGPAYVKELQPFTHALMKAHATRDVNFAMELGKHVVDARSTLVVGANHLIAGTLFNTLREWKIPYVAIVPPLPLQPLV